MTRANTWSTGTLTLFILSHTLLIIIIIIIIINTLYLANQLSVVLRAWMKCAAMKAVTVL